MLYPTERVPRLFEQNLWEEMSQLLNLYCLLQNGLTILKHQMRWRGGRHEINLPEFRMDFRWTYGEMMAVMGNEITSLYTGMPIWNAYFCGPRRQFA